VSESLAIGTVFEQPGFRGEVVGFVTGLNVMDVRLDGEVPAHAAANDEIAVILEGSVKVTVDGVVSTHHAGEWLIIPAGTPHEVVSLQPSRLLMVG
jgi:quercetin dioxygenase-like cupin family protein